MMFSSIGDIEKYLSGQIPAEYKDKFPGEAGLVRMRAFMEEMGNPQEKIKVIHIAGTSGKGSTAFLMSQILTALDFRVGLTVSPHLTDIRERVQINNKLLNEDVYIKYFAEFTKYIDKMRSGKWGAVTYFEILTGFAYWVFVKEKVDYAVVETGLGGLLDGTNVIENRDKISVITRIGLDHTHILGGTLSEVADQKAGIVQGGNDVIALNQGEEISTVIEKRVREVGASEVYRVGKGENYSNVRLSSEGTVFDFEFKNIKWKGLKLAMLGEYQAENASVALATLNVLSVRDGFDLSEKMVREVLARAVFPGRMSVVVRGEKQMILDGAHNLQKMRALVGSLKKIFPDDRFTFVVSFKRNKSFQVMLEVLAPIANKIIVTRFSPQEQGLSSIASKAQEIADSVKGVDVFVKENPKTAFDLAMAGDDMVVVTGSLYLVGDVYKILEDI